MHTLTNALGLSRLIIDIFRNYFFFATKKTFCLQDVLSVGKVTVQEILLGNEAGCRGVLLNSLRQTSCSGDVPVFGDFKLSEYERTQDLVNLTFCFGEIVYHAILSVFLVNIDNYRRAAVEKFVVKKLYLNPSLAVYNV